MKKGLAKRSTLAKERSPMMLVKSMGMTVGTKSSMLVYTRGLSGWASGRSGDLVVGVVMSCDLLSVLCLCVVCGEVGGGGRYVGM